jgi:hypothetical protein
MPETPPDTPLETLVGRPLSVIYEPFHHTNHPTSYMSAVIESERRKVLALALVHSSRFAHATLAALVEAARCDDSELLELTGAFYEDGVFHIETLKWGPYRWTSALIWAP